VNELSWNRLLQRIADRKCTPFVGAAASLPILRQAKDIAEEWTRDHRYPLEDSDDLARVAQYLAVHADPMAPKEMMRDEIIGKGPPDFSDPEEPHALLADLGLPLYITTNYDDFMVQALRDRGRDPVQEICKWNDDPLVQDDPAPLGDDHQYEPTPERPVVFHLHGRLGIPESMVLTEDDYLEFLVTLAERSEPDQYSALIPHQVARALSNTSLIFIGYGLKDWDFRVLHRGLVMRGNSVLRRMSVTVQLERTSEAQDYLDKYFERNAVSVFWGQATTFTSDLREKWGEFQSGGG
jgi:SIR2-like domain